MGTPLISQVPVHRYRSKWTGLLTSSSFAAIYVCLVCCGAKGRERERERERETERLRVGQKERHRERNSQRQTENTVRARRRKRE